METSELALWDSKLSRNIICTEQCALAGFLLKLYLTRFLSNLIFNCLPYRSNYGDYFGITVAGYPEAHPEVISDDAEAMEKAYQSDLHYLKEKVCHLQFSLSQSSCCVQHT